MFTCTNCEAPEWLFKQIHYHSKESKRGAEVFKDQNWWSQKKAAVSMEMKGTGRPAPFIAEVLN